MLTNVVTICKVRLEEIPLPVPSDVAAGALFACTQSSVANISHSAPAVEGMMSMWGSISQRNFTFENNFGIDSTNDDAYSSIECEARPVRELVQLCIIKRVSTINNVLLLRAIQPTAPLQIFGFVQVNAVLQLTLVL
jgi:hypothetical protein